MSKKIAVEVTVIFQDGRADFGLTPSIAQPPDSSHTSSHTPERVEIRAKIMAMIQDGSLKPHPSRLPLDNRKLATSSTRPK